MRYQTKRTPAGWRVIDTSRFPATVVEKHSSQEKADRATAQLNGICLHCGQPLAQCRIDNPRDPNFGAEEDNDE
jgi:hypothetical protein